jgi:choline dehydrogenase-like flavoprotein
MTFVVIGSGPAGVAAAHALSAAGRHVTILDAGDTIEPGRMAPFDALAKSDPEAWPPELARHARGAFPVTAKHVPLKPAYGSLFPYALNDPDLPIACHNAAAVPSLALGGLSNSWGASMLPVRRSDIADWPITLDDLAPHYEAVLRFVPVAAERDELSEILPLYTASPGRLQRTLQAEVVLAHMRAHAAALKANGFAFGRSRLAVRADSDHPNGCRQSGMCLYGCPYRSIYNSSQTLTTLIRTNRVDYRGGIYVDRLTATGDTVSIDFHDRRNPPAKSQITASRVFVACGSLSSPRLILESLGHTRSICRLLDSQYFVIPMATSRAVPVSVATQGNTLAQVFVELEDSRISDRTTHLQLYGYNDLMLSVLAARLPLSADALEPLLRPVLGRMIIIQGYLHSDDSPGITLEITPDGVRLVGHDDPNGGIRVRRLARTLAVNARSLGMLPIPGLAQPGLPGKGNHLGGSFPMRRAPGPLETDTLGRLPLWERVHLVDASVLPSVPATTVTLSVMANSHRIAGEAAGLVD